MPFNGALTLDIEDVFTGNGTIKCMKEVVIKPDYGRECFKNVHSSAAIFILRVKYKIK